jgi:hypothetical protein
LSSTVVPEGRPSRPWDTRVFHGLTRLIFTGSGEG